MWQVHVNFLMVNVAVWSILREYLKGYYVTQLLNSNWVALIDHSLLKYINVASNLGMQMGNVKKPKHYRLLLNTMTAMYVIISVCVKHLHKQGISTLYPNN